MANKNINELEVLEALEGGEKVLLSTDNGAKLFDAAGIASSGGAGGGAGEDITIVLEAQVDPEGYGDPEFDELVVKKVECSITEEQFIDKLTNGVLRLGCYAVTEPMPEGSESPAMISTRKLKTQGLIGTVDFSYIYGDMTAAMIGVDKALILMALDQDDDTIGGHEAAMFFGFIDGEFTRIAVEIGY